MLHRLCIDDLFSMVGFLLKYNEVRMQMHRNYEDIHKGIDGNNNYLEFALTTDCAM